MTLPLALPTSTTLSLADRPTLSELIARADTPAAAHVFVKTLLANADLSALQPGVLHGVPVSVKDLYDTAGDVTTAGSRVLAGAAPATLDAPVVARLRAAGALIVGRTNMTEFAYSGVGYNPHYGTPANPCEAAIARIPGGSSSGAAVSVVLGLCAAALGSDTGGSIRVPAALCGIVGYKPTQALVPLAGTVPLSTTLDTACAMTNSVADAIAIHNVIADTRITPLRKPAATLRFLMPSNWVLSDMDATVKTAFERSIERLRRAGCTVLESHFAPFDALAELSNKGGIVAAEAYAYHASFLASNRDLFDPLVAARIEKGATQSAADYLAIISARQRWIATMHTLLAGFDGFICPTVPIVAPPIKDVMANDASFARFNALLLRNTSIGNLLDGCSISLPAHTAGELPVGLMLTAIGRTDARLLGAALVIEKALAV